MTKTERLDRIDHRLNWQSARLDQIERQLEATIAPTPPDRPTLAKVAHILNDLTNDLDVQDLTQLGHRFGQLTTTATDRLLLELVIGYRPDDLLDWATAPDQRERLTERMPPATPTAAFVAEIINALVNSLTETTMRQSAEALYSETSFSATRFLVNSCLIGRIGKRAVIDWLCSTEGLDAMTETLTPDQRAILRDYFG